MAKRENSKVETSQVVADAIAVKTMGDRIREASRCSHALRRGGSAVSVGTESGGCGSVELVASRPETGHGDNAGQGRTYIIPSEGLGPRSFLFCK